jgi:transcriptional regulator with XRE-family HTH domain
MKQSLIGLTGEEARPYCGDDLDIFRKHHGLSMNELAVIYGQTGSSSALKRVIECGKEVVSPTIQLLMRLYLRFPDTIPLPERLTVSVFFEDCLGGETAIATRFRGILFGVDRNSGYNWGKDAAPMSHVKAIMIAAKKIKQNNGLTQEDLLQLLIENFNMTTASLNVNPLKNGSWGRKNTAGEALSLSVNKVCDKAVKNCGRRAALSKTSKLSYIQIHELSKMVRAKLHKETNYTYI